MEHSEYPISQTHTILVLSNTQASEVRAERLHWAIRRMRYRLREQRSRQSRVWRAR